MTETILVQEPQDLTVGSTNTVRLVDWEDTDDGSSPDDWTVTIVSVLDSLGAVIAGTTNLPMAHTPASTAHPACYKGVVPSTAAYVLGACTTRILATAVVGTKVRRFDVPGTILANPHVP